VFYEEREEELIATIPAEERAKPGKPVPKRTLIMNMFLHFQISIMLRK
jgi:hypothetical protein